MLILAVGSKAQELPLICIDLREIGRDSVIAAFAKSGPTLRKPDASGRRLLSWLGGSYPPLPHQQASEDRGMLPTIRALPQLPLTIHHRLHYPAFGRLVGFGMGPITVDTLLAEARRYGCVLDASLGLIRGRASRNIVLKSP